MGLPDFTIFRLAAGAAMHLPLCFSELSRAAKAKQRSRFDLV